MVLLILYPVDFCSKSKFDRKLDSALLNRVPDKVVYIEDYNGYIEEYFFNLNPRIELEKIDDLKDFDGVSHSIIFDDGEEFRQENIVLRTRGVEVRRFRIKITRVINIRRDPIYEVIKSSSEYVYIGRGSCWGNPYSMAEYSNDRDEVIRMFKYDFDYDKFPHIDKSKVYSLAGKRLGCYCKPENCHGDVIADFLNSWDDGE